MKKRSRWDFNTPEGLNDIQMSKGSTEFINEEEKKHYKGVTKHMTPAEVKYMCTYMWRLGYATAIKETGAEVPEHRRVYENKNLN